MPCTLSSWRYTYTLTIIPSLPWLWFTRSMKIGRIAIDLTELKDFFNAPMLGKVVIVFEVLSRVVEGCSLGQNRYNRITWWNCPSKRSAEYLMICFIYTINILNRVLINFILMIILKGRIFSCVAFTFWLLETNFFKSSNLLGDSLHIKCSIVGSTPSKQDYG